MMKISEHNQKLLRLLPGVDQVLERCKNDPFFADIPKTVLVKSVRQAVDSRRSRILAADQGFAEENLSDSRIMESVKTAVSRAMTPNLKRLVNGTGVVVHTNLGRSLLPEVVLQNVALIAGSYSNLEYDLQAGQRGPAIMGGVNLLIRSRDWPLIA